MAVSEAEVLDALRAVQDPDLHKDLVTLGMVQKLRIEDGVVSFDVVLTTPACPMKDKMQEDARLAVMALPGVSDVHVTMDAQVTGRIIRPDRTGMPNVRNIVAVASNKGGVGKTTVAVNLAIAMAKTGARVGLLDADITGPNVPLMMGVLEQPNQPGEGLPVAEAWGVKFISIAFFLPSTDSPVIWRGPMVSGAIQQMLRDAMWGELDYLVVDLPPGTGDAALTLAQAVPLSGAVVVITPQEVAVMDAVKAIGMFQRLEVPVLGLVENMSYFLCPHCGERTEIFGHGGAQTAAEKLNLPFLGEIPISPLVRAGSDEGLPVTATDADKGVSLAFDDLAGQVARKISVLNAEAKASSPFAGRIIPLMSG
jgi:ATP-binding protein involved in chromosome partitioning